MTQQNSTQRSEIFLVNIEFLRVQTFLFAVPRLRPMIGANVLLGETVRKCLREAVKGMSLDNNHGLIQNIKNAFPPGLGDDQDPLAKSVDPDDPQALIEEGILTRDGGHFSILFKNEINAGKFKTKAETILREELPGLRFEIIVKPLSNDKDEVRHDARATCLVDLPIFQVCRESGNGAAEVKSKGKRIPVSRSVKKRQEKGNEFFDLQRKYQTFDIIGLLKEQLPLVGYCKDPEDLNQLCGDDDLAVIHADGNRVGLRYKEWKENYHCLASLEEGTILLREGHGEEFFHRMRSGVRFAVLEALKKVFNKGKFTNKDYLPYQLLMLGGDDLLMVCRAREAFPLLEAYAKALQDYDWGDEGKLTIGAGVAIGHPNVPFHRLQGLAEELASSAKRLHRALLPDQEVSVVDWLVFSESWAENPIAQRRRDSFIRYPLKKDDAGNDIDEELALTCRPYPILGETFSLEALSKGVAKLEGSLRSQLRTLVEELPRGRGWADLCWRELPDEVPIKTRSKLEQAVSAMTGETKAELWIGRNNRWKTVVGDLVEFRELMRCHKEKKRARRTGGEVGNAG